MFPIRATALRNIVPGAEGRLGMKRTPLWVFVAAVAVQVAALCLCVFAMEHWSRVAETPEADAEPEPAEEPPVAPREPPQPPAPVPQTAEPLTHAREPVAAKPAEDVRGRPQFGPPPERVAEPEPPAPAPREPFRPRFAPLEADRATHVPATNGGIPSYITEAADGATQLVTGTVGDRPVTFGFYPDGNIRYVDVDGGRYAGKAESARARMREIDGTRAFTVQIGVAADGHLQATFTGGLHDAATFPLEPLVGWSVA
jgi:outer membrane biosynthesis protein TonB